MNSEENVLLEVKHLSVEFNGFQALTDVNMKIYDGELRVIIGPNGAGKTTFMDLVTGKTVPSSGKILFDGQDITGKNTTLNRFVVFNFLCIILVKVQCGFKNITHD